MARARNIKPGFFKNEELSDATYETRLLFIGLWTLADREGRLEDRPRRIRAEIFPFDGLDVDPMLNKLQSLGFLSRYEVDGSQFIQITNFVKHQDPHYREKASEIPPPPGGANEIVATGVTRTQRARILERDGYACQKCGSDQHLCIDHVLPVSRGGDSSDENLQVLCLPCNTKKSNKLDGEDKNCKKKGGESLPSPYFGSTSIQHRLDVASSKSSDAPLIPDSLIPDSLIPDSLIPDSLIPDSLIPESSASPKAPPAARGTALPRDWLPTDEQIDFCCRERPDLTPSSVASRFRDYWIAVAGAKGRKLDWDATWRNWVRNEKTQPARASPQAKFDPVAFVNRNRPSNDRPNDIIDIDAKPVAGDSS